MKLFRTCGRRAMYSILGGAGLLASGVCFADQSGADQVHVDVGPAYVQGLNNVTNAFQDDVAQTGGTTSSKFKFPVGLVAAPYYLTSFNLGIGLDLGPLTIVSLGGSTSTLLPLGADVRYVVPTGDSAQPYVRVGVRDPIVSGGPLKNGKAGAFAALGLVFPRTHIGFEVAVDNSKVDVVFDGFSETVKPIETMVSIYAHF